MIHIWGSNGRFIHTTYNITTLTEKKKKKKNH